MASEFSIIEQYFNRSLSRPDVMCGIGDDAAIVQVPPHESLVVTTDTLNVGVHFPADASPADIAYKALMVNLSDLAAMGATPRWITLSLTLPETNADWLHAFSQSLHCALQEVGVALIGGDTTRGPLSVSITAMGSVNPTFSYLRSEAKMGDIIAVTGTLGDAGLGLQCALHQRQLNRIENTGYVLTRLHRPQARLSISTALHGLTRCAIDLSDGLASDLSHILKQSHCGAIVNVDDLPLSIALTQESDADEQIELALCAGDDYELCFCIPPVHWEDAVKKAAATGVVLTPVGVITVGEKIDWKKDNQPYVMHKRGWDHFA